MQYQTLCLRGCEPEQLTSVIDGSDMFHSVLTGGNRDVDIQKVAHGSRSMQRGRYGMGVLVRGAWPAPLVSVGVLADSRTEATVNGFNCPSGSIQLYTEGSELTYRAPPGAAWFVWCVERDWLQTRAEVWCNASLPIPRSGVTSFNTEPTAGERVTLSINEAFRWASCGADTREDAGTRWPDLEFSLCSALVDALRPDAGKQLAREMRRAKIRHLIMRRAQDYLRANLAAPFSLTSLASFVGSSPRVTEQVFRRAYGVTPHTWLRSMQLNAAREALKKARGTGMRIAVIAMESGYGHLGRFSVEYRRLFSESPRETLRMPPASGQSTGFVSES